ncbi:MULTISPECIES: GNAT family N-acetyltransferase [Bacillaceae]|uniref:GNAT family N-acetyltransferase n=1 Tax=Evansella alkalicola TaxID=745819 RepID=A0ABS6JMQ1_9BACI|nr:MULTISPECIES: GNAT family N-acetyltransferase [Bacillaceae]MBU9719840.1 GNAT family N-acetyltransferase [Bacillus alkalicola]
MESIVQLDHYSKGYEADLASFELPEEQNRYTSLPNKYTESIDGQHRIVILSGGEPVGFFILHTSDRVKDYSDNSNAMLLTSLSINQAQQGKGYGKQAMFMLGDFIKREFTSCNEVVLAVNHKNLAAQQLYTRVGFKDTGRRKIGPIGEQFILNFRL